MVFHIACDPLDIIRKIDHYPIGNPPPCLVEPIITGDRGSFM